MPGSIDIDPEPDDDDDYEDASTNSWQRPEPTAQQLTEKITFELRDIKIRLDQANHSLWAICILLGLILALVYLKL
jgi:hypothetical protein